MKPLLSKTTKPFLIYLLIILIVSVPAYYFMIRKIWISELDEHNRILAKTTEEHFKEISLSDEELNDKLSFWNKIQPGVFIEKDTARLNVKDSIFTTTSKSLHLEDKTDDNFRVLITIININGTPYYFRSIANYEDTKETVSAIAIVTFFFIGSILLGLLLINRYLAKTIWAPFRNTLDKLKNFNLNTQTQIKFNKTDTTEFDELNQSLSKLITHNVSVYKTQKEFTENASHELQTPLAILKNKLDILLQSDDLTEKQYNIAEDMNKVLSRSSRINQNLLLLAKIENSQFDNAENIHFDELLQNSLDNLQEHFEQKNIFVKMEISQNVTVNGNSSLTEILINNLLLNAIRHTDIKGSIFITLKNSVFEVANSGEEKLGEDLLFKRFSKLSANNSGSGLGLAIIKEVSKSQNWTVHYRFKNNYHIFSVHI